MPFYVLPACLVIGYCLGSIQTAYFYCKTHGIDIREHGSGNPGMTNTLRTLGAKAGFTVLILDMLKCLLAVNLTTALFSSAAPDAVYLIKMVTGLGAVLGHDFPFYMQFKGGKGIAATAGLMCAFHPVCIVVMFASFLIPFWLTHFVSLGSLMINICFVVTVVALGENGLLHMPDSYLFATYLITAFLAALAFYQHKANIKKLLSGNERKTYVFKKNKVQSEEELGGGNGTKG